MTHIEQINNLYKEINDLRNENKGFKNLINNNKKFIKFANLAINYHFNQIKAEKINSLVNFCNTGEFLNER